MCFLVLNPFNFRIKIQWLGWVTDRSLLPAHCLVCVFVHNLFSSKRLEWGWTLKERKTLPSLGKLLNLLTGRVWEAAWCGRHRSSSADIWFQRKAEKLEGTVSLTVWRIEGENRSPMVQRTAQGSKGTEQSWLQFWVTELKVQPSIEEHNGFVQGKELGLNHYLCLFFLLITVRFKYRGVSSFQSNTTGHFLTLKHAVVFGMLSLG